ncbi:MAG: 2-succinyl-5-enolpyruvyl-6-hydroxy-3-cyclohexene-1-carboxylic-acid synthase [Muribaculaceae bacterium]|nr:2-succinyl-5-enolpyruvyl-6-hydroxy-3-cyclohexene-1-carboxylic-acid synthase [Muribaculaceae bacterium]
MRKPNTEKTVCRMIARALEAYGIRRVVTSPGSRNAPLLMALARSGGLELLPVIDERCAAFEALGIADISGNPVALCCTSGSAMLNYAPAIAEAYYRGVPLVAITADRPSAWIDQADSQTIRQPGALSEIVKARIDINGDEAGADGLWHINRLLNDALGAAIAGPAGPVHINVHLSAPLTVEVETDSEEMPFRKIDCVAKPSVIPVETARTLAGRLVGRCVLVVGGFNAPDARLNRALADISRIDGFEVVDEGLANLRGGFISYGADAFSGSPDVLITFGGSLVSARMKEFLRCCDTICEHWHVGEADHAIDTFRRLSTRIDYPASGFFPRLAGALGHLLRVGDLKQKESAPAEAPRPDEAWSSKSVVRSLLEMIPREWNIQLGNGMSVRHALHEVGGRFHRVSSNRGVSGIDGCVSTAVGASLAYDKPTLLIVGDMSAQYDLGALASAQLSPKFKVAVLDNGGGEIFRLVATTRGLPERERLIAGGVNLPLRQLAEGFGFRYVEADSRESLSIAAEILIVESERPCILRIITGNK